MCHSVLTMVELISEPRPDFEAGCRVSSPKSAEFLMHILKNAESNTELKALGVY